MQNLDKTPIDSRALGFARALVLPFIAVALIGFILAACAQVEAGRLVAAKVAAKAVNAECALSADQRQQNLDAINAELSGSTAKATALDCDGDGAPDF